MLSVTSFVVAVWNVHLSFDLLFHFAMHIHTCFIVLFNTHTFLFYCFCGWLVVELVWDILRWFQYIYICCLFVDWLLGKIEGNLLFCRGECKGGY